MAKYTVQHSCGHEETHQLYGKIKDRESKLEWLEDSLCRSCWRKQQEKERQEANNIAAKENFAAGLKGLQGTEKQIAWAETIRSEKINKLSKIASRLIAGQDKLPGLGKEVKRNTEKRIFELGFKSSVQYFDTCHLAIEQIQNERSASWWIDHRDIPRWEPIIESKALAISEETQPDAISAKAESTIIPDHQAINTPAEISIIDNTVTVLSPGKNRDLWEIIKLKLGFSWTGEKWELDIGIINGTAVDRAAEAGHMLLAAGFPVIIWNEDVREKAIAGDYEPRHTRWITKNVKTGEFNIKWSRSENFYDEARLITGSGWSSPCVTVPPGEHKEVLDFADEFDFKLSIGARELISEQETLLAGATVIKPARVKDKEQVDKSRKVLVPDTVSGDIDADLADN